MQSLKEIEEILETFDFNMYLDVSDQERNLLKRIFVVHRKQGAQSFEIECHNDIYYLLTADLSVPFDRIEICGTEKIFMHINFLEDNHLCAVWKIRPPYRMGYGFTGEI